MRVSGPPQSPSLSGCLCENKSLSPSIIPAEVHKVDNPYVALFLTHVGSELGSFISCCELRSANKTWASLGESVTARPTAAYPARRRRISALMLSGRCWRNVVTDTEGKLAAAPHRTSGGSFKVKHAVAFSDASNRDRKSKTYNWLSNSSLEERSVFNFKPSTWL